MKNPVTPVKADDAVKNPVSPVKEDDAVMPPVKNLVTDLDQESLTISILWQWEGFTEDEDDMSSANCNKWRWNLSQNLHQSKSAETACSVPGSYLIYICNI